MNQKTSSDTSNAKILFKELLLTSSDLIFSTKSGEIKVSLKSLPYFADHAFQDMIVLPGSTYAELVLVINNELFNKVPQLIKNINFGNLTILSDEDVILKFAVSDIDGRKKFEFYEQNNDNLNDRSLSTTLEVEDINFSIDKLDKKKNDIDEFINNADSSLLSDYFYNKLRSNGNQYGPDFQNIKQIWIKGDEALCKLDFSNIDYLSEKQFLLNPVKLDSFTQLLSALSDDKGRTFILTSISEIHIRNSKLSEQMWCRGKLLPQKNDSENEFEGELKVFDVDGFLCLELYGVKFKYMDKFQQKEKSPDESKNSICIASTFTAEPVEDPLNFWNNFLNFSSDIQFAPYNQVFQELLNPHSLLSTNENGFNIILLGLEDWTRKDHKLIPRVNQANLFKDKSRYTLPNHLEIVHLNKYETEYVYKEIFSDKCYLKHGITINDGDTIIDVGANIGLFTLFVNQYCKDPVVYAFEPSPVVYDLLKANSEAYCSKVKTFNCGVSDKVKSAIFTFYEKSSVFSSFNPDENEDKEAIQAVVRNLLRDASDSDSGSLEEYVEEITSGRLESKSYECQLLSVSDIIKENNIEKIDLLKIDAEKSELDIIKGIKDGDWDKIKQVVIEIHDKSRKVLEEIEYIFKSKGFKIAVEEEKMLKESGLFNVFAKKETSFENQKSDSSQIKSKEDLLIENIENFVNALESFTQKSSVPLIFCVTPRSSIVLSEPELSGLYEKYEVELLEKINKIPNVYTISSSSLLAAYPVQNYYDSQGDELGHIPYTLPFFTSIGTALSRLIFSLQSSPYKVIALDCDNTLWKGVCGEDGPKGIQISEDYKFLQQFMIDQIQSGMLVCLCSKNNEEDVLEVFKQRDDMLLKPEHLVSWRTNWDYKSVNLRSLAEELNLGLDSFIFIDDNPVECAEVKANCPEVLTLQLPQKEDSLTGFLKNIWVFDHIKVTDEDKKRTKMYRENIQREKYLSSSLTLKDFLDGLNLQINISQPKPEQMERVSQLTHRTNQFNFTTVRRTEPEIINLLNTNDYNCLIVHVNDRFGDYGLVGVLIYKIEKNVIDVDTFLLSCRVLGRGVEHKFLSELGLLSEEKQINFIDITYLQTPKNRPALEFINSFGEKYKLEIPGGSKYRLPAEFLRNLKYQSASFKNVKEEENKKDKKQKKSSLKISSNFNDKIQLIGIDLQDPSIIYKKVEDLKITQTTSGKLEYVAPETEIEKKLTEIWQKVLGIKKVGLNDNFFEVGGTSLKAVQLLATLKKELKAKMSIVTLFECPTVELLSKKLSGTKGNDGSDSKFEDHVERGERRRQKRIVRKRSEN
jgi:FkbH-like protein/FkbM family methyltransferase